ncbi:MAG: 30S ribosome-binding factor RbfA [Erysipelotrichaceae bacterium]|nr:30S ribosome-binding factor RbfA [Erysipelotrichaceae bacterium]MDP3306240.1 30S ribosome-binding factor RbfA [Erysipelotrichaceae bacterium]
MTIKQERLEQIIRKEVSEIIQFKVKDPNISFVTVTDVEVTRDYSIATIYVTFFNRESGDDMQLQALNRAKGYIRSELGSTLTVRKVPELLFRVDDSLDKGNRIDQLLKNI